VFSLPVVLGFLVIWDLVARPLAGVRFEVVLAGVDIEVLILCPRGSAFGVVTKQAASQLISINVTLFHVESCGRTK
jgi:hypothetical protein